MSSRVSMVKAFGGHVSQYKHSSKVLNCEMKFHMYIPPTKTTSSSSSPQVFPLLFFLSGLTCDDTNFITKSGAIQYASQYGIVLVCPDTSPRGDDIPDGTAGEWDFGKGAGFYLNATKSPFDKNYKMYDYVTKELPEVLKSIETDSIKFDYNRKSIFGHSMGGHGALTIYLKNLDSFKSVSAFSPICHPLSKDCKWGVKAFSRYLTNGDEEGKEYDAVSLVLKQGGKDNSKRAPVLIDQGGDDKFLHEKQLQPEAFVKACQQVNFPVNLRMQDGYDHSYYFISSFVKDHMEFHSKHLNE